MSAYGIPQEDIARVIGITGKTLRANFRDEIELGAITAHSRVARTAFQLAVSGKVPAATFFWLKCRAGWRDRDAPPAQGGEGYAPPLGKKEQAQRDAETAGAGSDWGDDLMTATLPN